MVIVVNESLPKPVAGWLTQWFVEVHHNVYVGTMNARVRQEVILYLKRNKGPSGAAVCVYTKPSEVGYVIEPIGRPSMSYASFDGLILPMTVLP